MSQHLIAAFDRVQRISLIVGIVALALCVIGLLINSAQTLQSYLFAYLFWARISIGCLAVLMIQFTVKGAWGIAVRRPLEAGALTIPVLAILLIPILIGMQVLYPWAQPEVMGNDAVLQQKAAYLNIPFFIVRSVVYFALWSGLAYVLRRWSRRDDIDGDLSLFQKMQNLSIAGSIALAVTATFAMIDWIMSLEPRWSSTIYAVMVAMGGILAGFALVLTLVTRLSGDEPYAGFITPGVLNDLGNLLLAGLLMWAYLAFSQYLVIWTGNLSDEIPWYLRRLNGGWQLVALIIVVLHFVVPFVLLLSPALKRRAGSLSLVAILLVAMSLIDAYWLVIPGLRQGNFAFSWTDFVAPVGIGGLWVATFLWQLKQSPLLPRLTGAEVPRSQEAVPNG